MILKWRPILVVDTILRQILPIYLADANVLITYTKQFGVEYQPNGSQQRQVVLLRSDHVAFPKNIGGGSPTNKFQHI